jgi:hypothetical protein
MKSCCKLHSDLDIWHLNNQINRSRWIDFWSGPARAISETVANFLTRHVGVAPPDALIMANELIAQGGGDLVAYAVKKSNLYPCNSKWANNWEKTARALGILV